MGAIFVAGTDTGVGKTVVTGLLAGYLEQRGYRVATQKWVQTGGGSDPPEHLRRIRRSPEEFRRFLRAMSPYEFPAPASPHLAAELAGTRILKSRTRRSFEALSRHFEFVIVEGTGGLMVPASRKALLIDWVREFGLPVLLVAGNRLGAINHALLSLDALESRKMPVLGVIFNNLCDAGKSAVLADNPKVVRGLSEPERPRRAALDGTGGRAAGAIPPRGKESAGGV